MKLKHCLLKVHKDTEPQKYNFDFITKMVREENHKVQETNGELKTKVINM